MEKLITNLKDAGLSSKESEVYLSLLKNGSMGGGDMAKLINMDRTHVYNLLGSLVNKGLVSYIEEGKKIFQATSPTNLLNEIEKKKRTIEAIIPELKSYKKPKSKPLSVKVLEGKSGLRAGFKMLLESKPKEILIYGATCKSYEVLEYEMLHFTKKIQKAKIKGRAITSKKLKGHIFTLTKGLEIRYVEELTPSSIMIFDDKVAISVFDEKISLIVIESKSVADSHRKHFEQIWETASSN